MNAKQNNILTMGRGVVTVLDSLTATSGPLPLQVHRAALKTTVEDITDQAAVQSLPIKGKTKDRNFAIEEARAATNIVAAIVHGYALDRHLADLAAKVSPRSQSLTKGRFVRRVQFMQQVHTAASDLVADLTPLGLTAEMLDDLKDKIGAALEVIDTPRATIVTRRVATARIAAGFRKMDRLLKHAIDPIMELRRTTDPDGYERYRAARLVIERPGSPEPEAETTAPPAAATTPPASVTPLAA